MNCKIKMKNIWLFLFVLVVAACGSTTGINLGPYYTYGPTKNDFRVCHGYSCQFQTPVHVSDKEWNRLLAPLKRSFKTAEAERTALVKVLANIEKLAGKKSGTDVDLAEARGKREDDFQMDCIDETANMSLYFRFIEEAGLLKLNKFERPVHRGYLVDGRWPHNAVTVRDLKSNELYVIDAFYKDNGKAPYIIPFDEWVDGWRP